MYIQVYDHTIPEPGCMQVYFWLSHMCKYATMTGWLGGFNMGGLTLNTEDKARLGASLARDITDVNWLVMSQ